MAIRYYDDALAIKLKKWIPDNSKLRILKPNESKRLFETTADDNNDKPLKLPLIALSRSNDIELLLNVKNQRSYDGIKLLNGDANNPALLLNIIPIRVEYQLDIYTKTYTEGDEYLRNFLFKLINNPALVIDIPYNNTEIKHIANIRVLSTVSDSSDISERLFSGQFTRWTIQLEMQDAFLFSLPYKQNWRFDGFVIENDDYTGGYSNNNQTSNNKPDNSTDSSKPEDTETETDSSTDNSSSNGSYGLLVGDRTDNSKWYADEMSFDLYNKK